MEEERGNSIFYLETLRTLWICRTCVDNIDCVNIALQNETFFFYFGEET